jgi:hypothetical protein
MSNFLEKRADGFLYSRFVGTVDDAAVETLFKGQLLPRQADQPTAELVRVASPSYPFAGLATPADDDHWRAKKMFD